MDQLIGPYTEYNTPIHGSEVYFRNLVSACVDVEVERGESTI